MDATLWIVLAVVLFALGAGGVAVAARGDTLPARLAYAGERMRRVASGEAAARSADGATAGQATLEAPEVIDLAVAPSGRGRSGSPPVASLHSLDAADPLREPLAAVERRLARLDDRLDGTDRGLRDEAASLRRSLDDLASAVAAIRSALAAEVAGLDARQSAALERIRAELAEVAGLRGSESEPPRADERRAECAGDLYARVARLESAIAQVTNPVLLPGESYAPPAEFLPESLAWENWKDVGERAFALADGFSSQRIYLSDGARTEVAGFVTTLRGVLTRIVYPNLAVDATPAQIDALRGALGTLAAELPAVRRSLEREYRAAVGEDGATGRR